RPLFRFDTVNRFAKRHGIATLKEFVFEWSQHNDFNTMQVYYAWPILMLSDERNSSDWLFLVQPGRNDKMLPKEGERCQMKIPIPTYEWTQMEGAPKQFSSGTKFVQVQAIRIGNPCSGWGIKDHYWQRCMAFEVTILKSEPHPFTVILGPEVVGKGFSEIPRPGALELYVAFELRLSRSTRNAELQALDEFVSILKASKAGQSSLELHRRAACEFLLAFEATSSSSLYKTFPHLADPIIAPQKVSPGLRAMFSALNSQQINAFKYGLSKIPNNICFVAGGPGAGKTHWNLCLVAAIQSKHEILYGRDTQPQFSRNEVLYLVDINSSATDVANKLVQMYDKLGLDRNVVRFYSWNNTTANETTSDRLEAQRQELHESERIKFTQYFLPLSKSGFKAKFINHRHDRASRVAPTLEEAAVDFYNKHKDTKYIELRDLFSIKHGDLSNLKEYLISQVYKEFLQNLDVIVTTPVTASKFVRPLQNFNPKLVIFDEAPHARELSFLIPITLFNPRVWIFTGDHRQTKPYVGSYGSDHKINEYVLQLRTSTMERAAQNMPNMTSLLINHRARGGLHEPASTLFYDSKMVPAIKPGAPGAIPPSTKHLREKYIMAMKGNVGKEVSRLVVVLEHATFNREESRVQGSLSNEAHRDWVEELVLRLVKDPMFLQTNGKDRGTILIISPYKKAVTEYRMMVREIREGPSGLNGCVVEARTVDTSQGHEADVVILDFVSDLVTTHLQDPNRLCVALTRARQAEFVLMNSEMVSKLRSSGKFSEGPLAEMLEHCMNADEFVRLPMAS
ncbi:P-loop containing nucleoside triphosphate hydrolase protein, partial [Diaporthe sp. PMI_573]